MPKKPPSLRRDSATGGNLVKGSKKMEIMAAILGGLIAATLTVIVMGIMNSYAIDRETEIIRRLYVVRTAF